jgi:rubrerythrin
LLGIDGMELDRLLAQCRAFEARAAAVYRGYASRTRSDPELCALWTSLARQEEAHAATIARAASWLDPVEGWHTTLDGWTEAVDEIEERLAEAENPEIGADVDRQLVAAMALERTELDTLFTRLLTLVPARERIEPGAHTAPLLAMAARRSANHGVAMEAVLLAAHERLRIVS